MHVSPKRPQETELGYQRRITDTLETARVETNRPSQPTVTGGPQKFAIGAKVQNIYDGKINTVSRVYWQYYAGEGTEDYTVEFAEGGWNKSTNLRLAVNAQQTDTP